MTPKYIYAASFTEAYISFHLLQHKNELMMNHEQMITNARITGFWYLMLAISGILGFLVLHPKIFVSDNFYETAQNLIHVHATARARLLLEFVIMISQALSALWFYRLFREINAWAAWATGIWGMMNATAIMVSAIAMGSAMELAQLEHISFQEKTQWLYPLIAVISNAWGVGSVFFGLWLIPMGFVVVESKRMPIGLGRILMIGGAGYILSAFIGYADFGHSFVNLLTIPATIGEFWMIGYLLIYGIRPVEHA